MADHRVDAAGIEVEGPTALIIGRSASPSRSYPRMGIDGGPLIIYSAQVVRLSG